MHRKFVKFAILAKNLSIKCDGKYLSSTTSTSHPGPFQARRMLSRVRAMLIEAIMTSLHKLSALLHKTRRPQQSATWLSAPCKLGLFIATKARIFHAVPIYGYKERAPLICIVRASHHNSRSDFRIYSRKALLISVRFGSTRVKRATRIDHRPAECTRCNGYYSLARVLPKRIGAFPGENCENEH